MQLATITTLAGRRMQVTSRPFELNRILSTFAGEVDLAAATLCRSTNLEVVAEGVRLRQLAAQAESAAKREMQLEPELEVC